MSITPFMNLDLPEVLQTLGPEWAETVNAAFEEIDEHDHSSGKGVKVKTSGLSINADLTFNNFSATNVKTLKLQNLSATQTGVLNAASVYAVSGDLYYTNFAGIAVQLTSGGSLVSTPASAQSFGFTTITSDLVIAPSDTFVFISTDTTAAREITLPLASSVVSGRLYVIKDKTGSADSNNITITPSGSDLIDEDVNYIISSPKEALYVISDGVSKWFVL